MINAKKFFGFIALLILVSLFFCGCVSQDKPIEDVRDHIDARSTTTIESTTTSSTSTSPTATSTSTTTISLATTTSTTTSTTTTTSSDGPIKVEVVYFHPSQPCANCIRVGQLALQTVNTYYSREVASGKVVYRKINLVDPSSSATVRKYGAVSSSIWIGTYKGDYFYKEQKVSVWYKIDDTQGYMDYLKETIDARLAGELP